MTLSRLTGDQVIQTWYDQTTLHPIVLVALQIVMTNPIWHLFVRIQLVHGSTGWYRFKMIDGFIRNFSKWWMLGTQDYSKLWIHPFDPITN